PVAPAGAFAIDGMSAAQIGVHPIPSPSIAAGAVQSLAFDVQLPANGYQADVLQSLAVTNAGTAAPGSDIAAVSAWVDDGDGAFDRTRDRNLGTLVFTGDRWQLSGKSEPVPLSGLHLFVAVDVPTFATNGRTI